MGSAVVSSAAMVDTSSLIGRWLASCLSFTGYLAHCFAFTLVARASAKNSGTARAQKRKHALTRLQLHRSLSRSKHAPFTVKLQQLTVNVAGDLDFSQVTGL